MKKSTLLNLLVLLCCSPMLAQTIYTANNNPGAPTGSNVFTGALALQDAIDAASSDDIIYVIPSQTSYGGVLINDKSLSVFGIGLNPSGDIGLRSLVAEIILDNEGASGSRISGLVVDNIFLALDNTIAHTISDLLIENCEIHRLVGAGFGGSNTSNFLANLIVRNCIFNSSNNSFDPQAIELTNAAGVIIENNIIRGECCVAGAVRVNGGTVRNNLFYDGIGNGVGFMDNDNSIIQNNIFVNTSPATWGAIGSGITYENNITYNTTADEFPDDVNGNSGSGNLEGVDPMLTNIPLSPGGDPDWSYSWDFTPLPGSPVLNAGTDGTDIGLTGGSNPFNIAGTVLPTIESLNVPTVVSQGSDLQVNIKAKGN